MGINGRRKWDLVQLMQCPEVLKFSEVACRKPGPPQIPEKAWGIGLIKWAIQRDLHQGRATVKGICGSINLLHRPAANPWGLRRVYSEAERNKHLRLFVRYVLSMELQFGLFDGVPGHYWTCMEGAEENIANEQFDLDDLVKVADYLQEHGWRS
ncbi:hypothetical protein FRB94_010640 [Tulasnella sp. JGI-2019a]|nr:hypothetical protein FRB94_010640 [Tulasnella sp. JGI-2019a]KAG9011336.1 hypothetical protein FRB93_003138 [Tulasnella sp. JGI-2019a]